MKRPVAYFAGTGRGAPATVMTNHDFAARGVETSHEWIVERTGIHERRIAGPDDTASGFAIAAAERALAMAGVDAAEVDLIVACTFSGDYVYPPVSDQVQRALRAADAQVLDVPAGSPLLVAERVSRAADGDELLRSEHRFPAHLTEFVFDGV